MSSFEDLMTAAIHGDEDIEQCADIAPPLHLTSTFRADSSAEFAEMATRPRHDQYYTRYGNPTVARAEKLISKLEGAESSLLFASGMGAISTAAMTILSAGDHVIVQQNHYMGTNKLAGEILPRFGVKVSTVSQTDSNEIFQTATDKTRMMFLESPANPTLQLTDLKAVGSFARSRGIITFCDGTLASPLNQRPLEHGVDLSMHAATKYLGGHHDLLAGVISGSKKLMEQIWDTAIVIGASASPFDAWLLIRGLRTFAIRMRQHNESASLVAQFLATHDRVLEVHYPGLASHPQHDLAREQMSAFGGLLSFSIAGGYAGAQRFMQNLQLIQQAVSLGGFESLAVHAAAMWEGTLGEVGAAQAGVQPNLIRLSVGLEGVNAIIADIDQALNAI